MRYTQFPNLFSSRPNWIGEDSDHQSIDFHAEASSETLTVAWAILLRSFTEEVAPIFRVFNNDVTVDTSDWASPPVHLVTKVEGDFSTGILDQQARFPIGEESLPHGFHLILQYRRNSQSNRLVGSWRLPSNILQNIRQQLVYILEQLLNGRVNVFSWQTISKAELSIVNENPQTFQGPELLHALLERYRYSPACALVFKDSNGIQQEFSYRELHDRSDRLATRIRALLSKARVAGTHTQDVIPVLMPQCPELYISVLAALKAGAAFCPLHLDAPLERIKFIVDDITAKLIITTSNWAEKISFDHSLSVILADHISPTHIEFGQHFQVLCKPRHLAYVMYTSGSTGQPKGVGITHLSASQALLAHDKHIPAFKRFLQFASPTFDVFVFEMFFPLFRGSTLVGCSRTELLTDLPAIMNSLEIDAAELTPSVVGTLIHTRSRVPKLKVLLTIGEMLTLPVIEEFGSSPSSVGILHGMYGPTEATIHCTLATSFSSQFKMGIIGAPLLTVSCFVIAPQAPTTAVSEDLEILPIGHVGELAIGGIQLAEGYINRTEQTSLAFIDTRHQGRIYRTGDKARLLPDGHLECLGRISAGQVKLRGQRVEIGEIEHSAYKTGGIKSATAVIIGGIVVLFCTAGIANITTNDVLESCRRWLPKFLLPSHVVFLEEVPRLPSGKIDVSKLKDDYERERLESTSGRSSDQNATEMIVSMAIQDLLGSPFDPSASFAAAGLDSLGAIRLASRLRAANFNIGVVDILKANTVQDLAQTLQVTMVSSCAQDTAPSIVDWAKVQRLAHRDLQKLLTVSEVDRIQEIIPCTPLQIAMLSETKRDHQAYCNWIELEYPSLVSFREIQAAIDKLANQNEILRSGFIQIPHQTHPFVQVIWKGLAKSQIHCLSSSNHSFQIKTPEEFLKPLRVKIENCEAKSRIVVQIHHALYDGWSWENVVRDFDLILRNQPLVERPQFRELVSYYRHHSASARLALTREYWQAHLQALSSCVLPNLHGKRTVPPGLRVAHIISTVLPPQTQLTSRDLGVSVQSIFQAAFAWLLSTYVGSPDVVYGNISSGRTLPVAGIEDIIGPCIATLPVRLDVSHSRTARDLIQIVHRLNRQMLEHHELPLRDIKKACGVDPGSRLFDSIFVWQQTLQGKQPELLKQINSADFLEFNLTLELEPRQSYFGVKITYQQAIMPEAQAEHFLHQLDQIISTFTNHASVPLSEIGDYIGEKYLSVVNGKPIKYPSEVSLSHPVEAIAESHPTKTAVEFAREINGGFIKSEKLSYSSLNSRANQVAHYLLKLKVAPDDLVCIYMEKCMELYVGVLGIIKSGAGYLPLTPETPVKRRDSILMESNVKICLCHSSLLPKDGEGQPQSRQRGLYSSNQVLLLCMDKIDWNTMSTSNPTGSFHPSNLAYAVFTSGTTGAAKGVLVTQQNIRSNLCALSNIYPTPGGSRLLQSCSHAFDVSVFEIFFSWTRGMCLCSATKEVLFRDLENAICAMEITHLSLTPTVASLVEPGNVPLVKFLVTAGEAVTPKVFQSWAGKGLYQGYGPSETTNICTVKPMVEESDHINNLGPPLPNTSAFVMQGSGSLTLVPQGGVGEFCFGGEQVFRGYLNLPASNVEKILCHPKYGRLYRSGDYGRILSDRSLQFVGRLDDQVKIRGQRVELSEINNLLLRSQEVVDVFTFVDQITVTRQRLLTFWVPKGHLNVEWRFLDAQKVERYTIEGLFSELVSFLPAYMIPSLLVPISCIPMTAQGKTDKQRLLGSLPDLGMEYIEYCSRSMDTAIDDQEWSEPELQISRIFCNTLECQQQDFGRRTSFFSLGLDSFSAVSFSKSLRENGFENAEASLVLRHPNIEALGNKLHQAKLTSVLDNCPTINILDVFGKSELDRIRRICEGPGRTVTKILPCTPLQEAMLSSSSRENVRSYYNHTVFEIFGSVERLRHAWQQVVVKHDILRTIFVTTTNSTYSFAQVVLSHILVDWSTVEVSDPNFEQSLEYGMDHAVAMTSNSLDPPYCFKVFESTHRTALILSMHHVLYDGDSIQLLLSEVTRSYDGKETPPAVPNESLLEKVISLDMEGADMFWKKHLQGLKPALFPRYSVDVATQSLGISGPIITNFSSSISLRAIESLCRKKSISLLGLTQASWAKLLSIYLGAADVCFGNVIGGRTLSLDGINRIVAPCFNTLPVRYHLDTNMSNMDLIEKVQLLNFEALPYQFTPLRRIQRMQNSAGKAIFDTLFILQKAQTSLDNHIWSVKKDVGAMDIPIVCETIPFKDKDLLQFTLHTQIKLPSQEYALRMLETLDAIMQGCLQFPSALVIDHGFLRGDLLEQATAASATRYSNTRYESPASGVEGLDSGTELKTDWTSDESEILDIFAKMSNVKRSRIGLQTTIFRLGLDSISAVQIAANLREKGFNASPVDVLEHPKVRELASRLRVKGHSLENGQESFDFKSFDENFRMEVCLAHGIEKEDLEAVRPCAPVQAGILAAFYRSGGSMYFNSLELQVPDKGEATLHCLETAWATITTKHQLLRTGFSSLKDPRYSFAMLIYPAYCSVFNVVEEEPLDLQEQTRIIGKEVLSFLHLPTYRVSLIKNSSNTYTLRLFILHALFDANTLSMILFDLARAYSGGSISPVFSIDCLLSYILVSSTANLDDQKSFWKDYLKGFHSTTFPNLTPLRVDEGEVYTLEVSCRMTLKEIQNACRDLGVTVQATGQTSWARLLAAYSGDKSVVFGSVYSGRTNLPSSTESVAFPSIVTLPVCANVEGTNREVLNNIMKAQSDLLKHQFTPLDKIQRWSGGNDGETNLFNTIFVYQNDANANADESWKIVKEVSIADYPISIELIQLERANRFKLRIVSNSGVLPREQASLLLRQLDAILTNTLLHPFDAASSTSSIPKEILSITSPLLPLLPSPVNLLHEYVELQAQSNASGIAYEFHPSLPPNPCTTLSWTYAALNCEKDKIAYRIRRKIGISPRSMIGICFRKCPEASFAILGILKAGCCFVAIDPDAPVERALFIIKDSGAKALFCTMETGLSIKEAVQQDDGFGVPIISLDDNDIEEDLQVQEETETKEIKITSSDLAYTLYTSGTTGIPKACLLTHQNTIQAMSAFSNIFPPPRPGISRFLQFASFHFDVSVLEQFWSWSAGITVTSAPRDVMLEDLASAISGMGVTHLDLTPSLASTLDRPDLLKGLCRADSVFITGGEALQQQILDVWGEVGCIYNGYGPTETTIGNTMLPRVPKSGKPLNIGPQFLNVGTYIFTPGTTMPALRGCPGELCISGPLVGAGYLNRPDLNAERFPFLEEYGEKIYRTGDLVRILCDNSFEFLGRADDQIKLRGQRLEIGEINTVIKRGVAEGRVRDVATLGIEHGASKRKQLVCFFALLSSSSRKKEAKDLKILRQDEFVKIAEEAREVCQGKLPPYMVPTHFIPVSVIPLSTNNKVESKKLRSLYATLSAADLDLFSRIHEEQEAIWSEGEKRVVDILSSLTGCEWGEIKRNASILRLGLDSISVVGFSRALKDAGFANAQVGTVMQSPIVGQLCKILTAGASQQPSSRDIHAQKLAHQKIEAFRFRHLATVLRALGLSSMDHVEALAPCTPLQEGIISRSLASEKPLYFEEFSFDLFPGTDVDRLRNAWAEVVASIQILRTEFCPTVDGYAQVVRQRGMPFPWEEKEFDSEAGLNQHKVRSLQEWWAKNHNRMLLGGRAFELLLLQSKEKRVMVLHIFHALYDGVSLPMMLEKVKLEYYRQENVKYGPSFLEILPYSPLCELKGAREFWIERLSGLEYNPLISLSSKSSSSPLEGLSYTTIVINSLSVDEVRRRHNTTHQSLVQAAWIMVLQKYFPSETSFGVVVSGRSIDFEEAAKVLGPLFNTIPFYPKLDGCSSWSDVIRTCHDFNTAVLPYQNSSLRDISKWCQRSPENPLFETLFVFQREELFNNSRNQPELWTQMETTPTEADYPISFEATLLGDEKTLKISIVAQANFSDQENSQRMLDDFKTALFEIATESKDFSFSIPLVAGKVGSTSRKCDDLASGKDASPTNQNVEFHWSGNDRFIRDEIALLADCEPSVINPQSSIFALGFDSIDAIKLSSRLKRHSIRLSIRKIMHSSTISEMVMLAEHGFQPAADEASKINLEMYEMQLEDSLRNSGFQLGEAVEAVLPPTPLQEAMFSEMSASNYSRYFNQDVLVLDPATDVEKLKEAWVYVIDQSPILRTSFAAVDDPDIPFTYAQVVRKPGTFRIRSINVDHEAKPESILQTVMSEDRATSNDVWLVRLTIVCDEKKTHLVLSLSHVLYDGWSLSLLHNDVLNAYHARPSRRPSYKATLEHILNSSGSEAARYWSEYISGAKPCFFPTRSKIEPQLQRSKTHRIEQTSTISASSIQAFVKQNGITMQSLGQACWALVLGSYLNSLEVVFGVVLSGRDIEEANDVLFPTMNTVVVRSIIHGSGKQFLLDMQNGCANAIQYQHFPLRKVQAAAKTPERRLFDSLFIVHRALGSLAANEKIYESVTSDSSVEFPVCAEIELVGNEFIWRTACADTVFDREGAKDLLDRLELVLQRLLKSPSDSTIELTEEGIAIFGLPVFRTGPEDNEYKGGELSGNSDSHLISKEWTSTESVIRKVLSAVSQTPEKEINKHQNIFHLGLDSISAIKVSSLLQKQSINLGVAEMLKAANIAKMSIIADAKSTVPPSAALDSNSIILMHLNELSIEEIIVSANIEPDMIERALPCTPGQVYMISAWKNSGGGLFHSRFHYEATEHLDRHRLSTAWGTLRERLSILRTAFVSTGNRKVPFLQVILKKSRNPINWLVDFSAEGRLHGTLDIPLLSLTVLLREEDNVNVLKKTSIFLDIHHALYDGVSLDIIMTQLQEIYYSRAPPVQAQPHIEDFLAAGLTDASQKARRSFWSTYLGKSDNPIFPLAEHDFVWTARQSQFTPSLISSTQSLFAIAKLHGISIQAIFFAAFAQVHASLLSKVRVKMSKDTVFGIYLANRSHSIEGIATLASPTLNLVPLRIKDVLSTSVVESAKSIQQDLYAISTLENSGVGLWEIFDWTGVVIDCFVNFLTLPGGGDNGVNNDTVAAEGEEMGWLPKILDPDLDQATWPRHRANDDSTPSQDTHYSAENSIQLGKPNAVADVYRQSIDIEAAIRSDGGMDVGIWVPERLAAGHSKTTDWVLERLKEGLENVG